VNSGVGFGNGEGGRGTANRCGNLCRGTGDGRAAVCAGTECQKAVKANPQSSLAHYRVAALLFSQQLDRPPNRWSGQYQASANAYRDALHGDGNPKWTKVWSYIGLGKIFDVTEQRERAVAQYQLAVQTNDNTRGAVDEARELLQKPYRLPDIH